MNVQGIFNLHRAPWLPILLIAAILLSSCLPTGDGSIPDAQDPYSQEAQLPATPAPDEPLPTPSPSRPRYAPGELVDYTAQTGDTLTGLALRFNTTVEEILAANTFVPRTATTMPPGMPMKIPIYYLPLWGSPYQIIPDSLFVNGPAQAGFNTSEFVAAHPGWLKNYSSYVSDANRSGAEIVDLVALNYSISPRLLLALLEYSSGALSDPNPDLDVVDFPLGYRSWSRKGLYMQLAWGANVLNNGYYGYRTGKLTSITYDNERLERFDPWQNAATIAFHYYFNLLLPYEDYAKAISEEGFAHTYQELFGDPWEADQPHIPGSLVQPEFILPFEQNITWAFTGGPHTGWGTGEPLAALDFAPPAISGGCVETGQWATAVAPGVVARSEVGTVVLDLDGDGDERTGWTVFYLHLATEDRQVRVGSQVERGDRLGHPSCEGGSSTGTHVHIARKYNGEWIPAQGFIGSVLAFDMEGWIAQSGSQPYQGTLARFTQTVTACTCSNYRTFIRAERR